MELFIQIIVYILIFGMFGTELWLSLLNYKSRNESIPESVVDVYDETSYTKYLQYTMTNFKFNLWIKGIDLLVIVVLFISGFFVMINRLAETLSSNAQYQVLLFLSGYFLINYVLSFVSSYIQTFKIEEKFGFNKSTLSIFVVDKIKSFVITVALGGALIYGLLILHKYTDWTFFIFAWLGLSIILIIVNLIYTSVIVPIFNKLIPLEDGSLKTKIEDFANSVGYQVSKISVMNASKRSSKLNAFFSGLGKSKRIVLYDTLIEKLSEEEIVAVLAHEIGHGKHKHILYNLIQSLIIFGLYLIFLMIFLETKILSTAFGFTELNIGFNLVLYMFVISPIAFLISIPGAYLSRKFEYQADNFVKVHYDYKQLISALKILAKENYSNLTPHPLYVKIFYSHPPIASRIGALENE